MRAFQEQHQTTYRVRYPETGMEHFQCIKFLQNLKSAGTDMERLRANFKPYICGTYGPDFFKKISTLRWYKISPVQ